MPRTVEQAITDAIARGAITVARAGYWRALARTRGDVPEWLDALTGSEVIAAGQRPERPFATVGDGPVAAAPPGADPAMYAANPLLYQMRRDRPALVTVAMADNPDPPTLFESGDLPPFTASGLPPSVLAGLPWPLRRPVAEAATLKAAYALVDKYAADPALALTDLAPARANLPYVQAMSAWLAGGAELGQEPPPQERSPYSVEQLHSELFGDTTFVPPRPAIPVDRKT
jgi:hypothetical protein